MVLCKQNFVKREEGSLHMRLLLCYTEIGKIFWICCNETYAFRHIQGEAGRK